MVNDKTAKQTRDTKVRSNLTSDRTFGKKNMFYLKTSLHVIRH